MNTCREPQAAVIMPMASRSGENIKFQQIKAAMSFFHGLFCITGKRLAQNNQISFVP
jgi:hypothetical protein